MINDAEYVGIVAQNIMKRLDDVRRQAAGLALEDAARWQDGECIRALEEGRQEAAQTHAEVAGGLRKRAAP